jgi:hypothetical protein
MLGAPKTVKQEVGGLADPMREIALALGPAFPWHATPATRASQAVRLLGRSAVDPGWPRLPLAPPSHQTLFSPWYLAPIPCHPMPSSSAPAPAPASAPASASVSASRQHPIVIARRSSAKANTPSSWPSASPLHPHPPCPTRQALGPYVLQHALPRPTPSWSVQSASTPRVKLHH